MRHVRRWAAVLITLAATGLIAVACGGGSSKAAGEACVSSTECDVGLVCDFGQNPPICATMSTTRPDAPEEEEDDAGIDPDAPDARPDAPPDAPPDAEVDAPDAV
jgi:hypothetical protein